MKTGRGFFDYAEVDIEAYRLERLAAFARLLESFGLARPPVA
jgi:3-hydroxybutyryl-CoA dehydrogenase